MALNEFGQEVPDQEPIVIRVAPNQFISQYDNVKAYIRQQLSQAAQQAELESFEEANDFDVADDLIPPTGHEFTEDQEERMKEDLRDAAEKAKKEFDEEVERQVEARLAARNEQGNAPEPARRVGHQPSRQKRPRQQSLQDLEQDDQ